MLGCFVVPVVVVSCCFDGCSWYMPLVDALCKRDANAGGRNIHLGGAAHHGYLHSRRSVENEGSLRKWLVRCSDLVSEDSQHCGQRRDINLLLTSTDLSSVRHIQTNREIWRENEMQ